MGVWMDYKYWMVYVGTIAAVSLLSSSLTTYICKKCTETNTNKE